MLRVVLCCDVDHDVQGYNVSATSFDVYKERLGWKSIKNVPKIKEICSLVKDCELNGAKTTWFIRSDEQLKIIFDDYAYPLRNFPDLWRKLRYEGDELAWHPHLWRWSEEKRCWFQEVSDNEWINSCLENGHREFLKVVNNLATVRMGWAFHNNFTMKKINSLGLLVDLSAAPGFRRRGKPDVRGSYFLNEYDWLITPEKPYFPSKEDYRRPAKEGEQSLDVLEIPVTTAPKSRGRVFAERAVGLAPADLRKKVLKGVDVHSRYIANLTKSSFRRIAKLKFNEALKDPETPTNLVAFFHPIELFKRKGFQNLEKNLKTLTEMSRKLGIPIVFLTAVELAKEIMHSR